LEKKKKKKKKGGESSKITSRKREGDGEYRPPSLEKEGGGVDLASLDGRKGGGKAPYAIAGKKNKKENPRKKNPLRRKDKGRGRTYLWHFPLRGGRRKSMPDGEPASPSNRGGEEERINNNN